MEEKAAAGLITAEWFGGGTCRWFTDNGWRLGTAVPSDSRAEDAAPLLATATVEDMAVVSLSKINQHIRQCQQAFKLIGIEAIKMIDI